MCDTMSMLGIASLVFMLCDLEFPASLLLLLALWVLMVASFVVGVVSTRLMVSSRNVAAWFGVAVNLSFDMESWKELPHVRRRRPQVACLCQVHDTGPSLP